jgi:hypothetical protein
MGTKTTLTESEVSTLTNALRCAADRYEADAETCRKAEDPLPEGWRRMAEQFDKQVGEARDLAEKLEMFEHIVCEGYVE